MSQRIGRELAAALAEAMHGEVGAAMAAPDFERMRQVVGYALATTLPGFDLPAFTAATQRPTNGRHP